MVKYRIALMLLSLAVAAPVLADVDPSMQDVYSAAQSGHLAQAQQMMTQVLRDHPRSAKAHYVAAEIYAKEGNFSLARGEFNIAEQLEPGLPFAKPEAVQALRSQIVAPGAGGAAAGCRDSVGHAADRRRRHRWPMAAAAPSQPHLWLTRSGRPGRLSRSHGRPRVRWRPGLRRSGGRWHRLRHCRGIGFRSGGRRRRGRW